MTTLTNTQASLTGEMFSDAAMADILSDRAWLQAMLDFEAMLARAQAEVDVIPHAAAAVIAAACDASLYDLAAIGAAATLAGNPGGPVAQALTAEVARRDPAAAQWVHYGATSQDVIDSGLAVIFDAATGLVRERLSRTCRALAALTDKHRQTPMAGRTVMQQALPIPFGLKTANWLAPLIASHRALQINNPMRLQFGGAAGTLAALGSNAAAIEVAMRRSMLKDRHHGGEVGWMTEGVPHHTDRSHVLRLASELGIVNANLGKIAHDVMLLMQTEIAELFEPSAPGKGGSSTMPHKRNPVQSLAIAACAVCTPGLVATMLTAARQEHERAAGGWQAEWDTMRQLFALTGAACLHAQTMLEGLEVDTSRMRANLEITGGLLMAERVAFALAPTLGKAKAKALLDTACKRAIAEKRHLCDVLSALPEAGTLDLDALFDPASYFGEADAFIGRILSLYEDERQHMPG